MHLTITGLINAYQALGEPQYLQRALNNASFHKKEFTPG